MSEEKIKLCIDCKYHQTETDADGHVDHNCKRLAKLSINRVTGRSYYTGLLKCKDERMFDAKGKFCGEDGIFFISKEA